MNIEENIPKGPNGEVTEVSKNAFERCINEANLTYRHRHAVRALQLRLIFFSKVYKILNNFLNIFLVPEPTEVYMFDPK